MNIQILCIFALYKFYHSWQKKQECLAELALRVLAFSANHGLFWLSKNNKDISRRKIMTKKLQHVYLYIFVASALESFIQHFARSRSFLFVKNRTVDNKPSLRNCLSIEIFPAPISLKVQLYGVSTSWGTVQLELC